MIVFDAAAPAPRVTYTGTDTLSPNFAVASALRSVAVHPGPEAAAESR